MTRKEAEAMRREFEAELKGKRKFDRPMIMAAFYKACLAAATVDDPVEEEIAEPTL